jgi:putative tryptophan/tyrosine transport system substrate-binding protein
VLIEQAALASPAMARTDRHTITGNLPRLGKRPCGASAARGLPTICEWAEMAQSGCLLGYGLDFTELEHRVANFVALIFRGTAPGELPIEQPTHFKFVINLKTAKAIGLTIPPSVSALADEVIE